MVAFSPESFGKLTALRLAAGEGLGEMPFRRAFVLKLRWSVEPPIRGGWSGSLQAAPHPAVSLPHLREARAASPWSAPNTLPL